MAFFALLRSLDLWSEQYQFNPIFLLKTVQVLILESDRPSYFHGQIKIELARLFLALSSFLLVIFSSDSSCILRQADTIFTDSSSTMRTLQSVGCRPCLSPPPFFRMTSDIISVIHSTLFFMQRQILSKVWGYRQKIRPW